MDLSSLDTIQNTWDKISEEFAVPKVLFMHQKATISLLLGGESVFVGSPTGSGKTLAQLSTVLFTKGIISFGGFSVNISRIFQGCALVIPPLQTIEYQMTQVCESWGISYLNLAAIDEKLIGEEIAAVKPKILISSIEKISTPSVQKQLFDLHLEYISLDEAQVRF